ncbi:outer membrane lipid asymmetry maintenance protein MlaD [Desulfuromonas versatilis]|uniref:Outer membrane lipid asymmetry maintenance protein MlaD n=1 Tax=Desulfuromonas versatilis TaxID=2802975 RepID=A0ABM8HY27_9BACT|nr:outer membrane lipid asymmetry maintenance protein MlaD [Desulfuromonas versatilis]BCR05628.1 outer membrane lipid asymmetry maintenance protein MlaD [Desulfuromonas versatilis]
MKRFNVETAVGLFLVAGFVCFAWLSVKLGDVNLFGHPTYSVEARFGSISGLKEGSTVEIAGVRIGKVAKIRLNPEDYEAVVTMELDQGVRLSEDSIASIRTAGIIGDRYVDIAPGGMEQYIEAGGRILETESAINLEELVSKYIFEKK